MFSLGVDIGGSHIATCVFDHDAKKLCKETYCSRKVNPNGSKEEILNKWIEAMTTSITLLGKPLLGVGVAMPGPFDYYNGISKIINVEKLQSLYNINLRKELAEKLRITPSQIRFINDASAFSIAESSIGAASAYRRVVAITLGTGLGASFTINGKPVIKANNVPDGGFLYNQYYRKVLADELFSTRGIIDAYFKRTGKRIDNVKELCDKVATDEEAGSVFKDFGTNLGHFIKPYLIDFDAEVFVLGGNISKAFKFFGSALKDQLGSLDKIYVSEFGEEAAIIGSALLSDKHFYTEIEKTLKLM